MQPNFEVGAAVQPIGIGHVFNVEATSPEGLPPYTPAAPQRDGLLTGEYPSEEVRCVGVVTNLLACAGGSQLA